MPFSDHLRPLVRAVFFILAIGLVSEMAVPAEAQERGRRYSKPASAKAPRIESSERGERVSTKFQFPVGSLVIVNNERKLYYITAPGEAIRYKVAVGKNEELWMGRTFVAAKVVDPRWIPVNGDDPVEGGDPANPLGKRALYLDWSLLRIHGTPSRGSIGSAVSNGCIRMLNEDVMDVFERVHFGAPVYAIRSWAEASLYENTKVAEKIYHDPAAHELAKEELQERLRERGLDSGEREANFRRRSRSAEAGLVRVNGRAVAVATTRQSRSTF